MSAPDSALPVFSFVPNWANGITERLEWLTDVLDAPSGAEQRNALRLSPRRSFDAQIDMPNAERTFLDLFVRRFGAKEFMLPLWHDHASLGTAASVGASSLPVDTVDREFVAGGMAILMGADAFSCEAVQVSAVASGSLTLAVPTVGAWAAGTPVHPLRRSRFNSDPKIAMQTDNYGRSPMSFMLSSANDYDGGSEDLTVIEGLPLLSPPPDWSQLIDLTLVRKIFTVDNKVGLLGTFDTADRGFAVQMHHWQLYGRAENAAFRRLLYRLRGKQAPLWLPSFTSDLTLAAAAAPGAMYIDVIRCGLAYAAFPAAGRTRALTAGNELLKFSTLAAPPSAGVERINLAVALVAGLSTGDILSFVDVGRMDTDMIELTHLTDTDGATQIAAPLHTFSNTRDGSAAGALELPTAAMTDDPCGKCGIGTLVYLNFKDDIYGINEVCKTVEQCVENEPESPVGGFDFSDIVTGVGLRLIASGSGSSFLISAPYLTAEARAALTAAMASGGVTVRLTFSLSVTGGNGQSFVGVFATNGADLTGYGDAGYFCTPSYSVPTDDLSGIGDYDFAISNRFQAFPVGGAGAHIVATTLSAAHIAASADGAAAVVYANTPYTFTYGSAHLRVYAVDSGGTVATTILEKVEFIAAVDDAALVALSAGGALP